MGSTTLFNAVFIRPEQVVRFLLCTSCNLSFVDLLQLVETTCRKPVDNKFWQSTCNKSVENLTTAINKLSQAMRTHPDIGLRIKFVARCQQTCNSRAFLALQRSLANTIYRSSPPSIKLQAPYLWYSSQKIFAIRCETFRSVYHLTNFSIFNRRKPVDYLFQENL